MIFFFSLYKYIEILIINSNNKYHIYIVLNMLYIYYKPKKQVRICYNN